MPKVLSYTPAWLARPSPGYQLFAPKSTAGTGNDQKKNDGPKRTIATRGSEVFVAVGQEIRWADLAYLKEDQSPAYRTLKVSIPLPIKQLSVSPAGDYLAVSTSHTVHVVVLPDASLLESGDDAPIKPKAFQIGPTAHVREESPVTTLLWHPLGYHGRCLLTITKSGVVRLWEINRTDRSTFSEPALSIDLPKLANAETDQEDLSASSYGASKGFSPDSVELEIASACFGDFPEQEGVHGWAPMTLWIATVAGDVYALCPLLPSKWQLLESAGSATFLQTLTSSINIGLAEAENESDTPPAVKKNAERQISWLSDILYQEPFQEETTDGESITVFTRPSSVPTIPLLQGPFSIIPEVDEFEISDMIVYSLKTLSDGTEDEAAEGVPAAVVCLLTDTCQVHVCLDLEGMIGRWLPSSEAELDTSENAEHDLIVVETLVLMDSQVSSLSQSITQDVHTDFSFFVSHASGVFYVSLEPWVRNLEKELSEPQIEGADFRLKLQLDSARSQIQQYIRRANYDVSKDEVTATVVVEDGNVGYLLLTTVDSEPQAVILDAPEDDVPTEEEIAEYMAVPVSNNDVREAWQPPRVLYENFDLQGMINVPSRHRAMLQEEIRYSPSTLGILMNMHKILSVQTEKLQHAVSELFNRTSRLQDEFRDQIQRIATLAPKVDAAAGDEETEGGGSVLGGTVIEKRVEKVKTRQEQLHARYEGLRRRMANIGGHNLSEKEAGLVEELQTMEGAIERSERNLTDEVEGNEQPPWERLSKVKEFQQSLERQVSEAAKEVKEEPGRGGMKVPSHSRKLETGQIDELLQRNAALVEAATTRLQSLGISIPMESAG